MHRPRPRPNAWVVPLATAVASTACGPSVVAEIADGSGTSPSATVGSTAGSASESGGGIDGTPCGDGIPVAGVYCFEDVPIALPEGITTGLVHRSIDEHRLLVADEFKGLVSILDYVSSPAFGPIVATHDADFEGRIYWVTALQMDTDAQLEVITGGSGRVIYEASGNQLEVEHRGYGARLDPFFFMFVPIDVDGDGIDELVHSNARGFAVWRATEDGTWTRLSEFLPAPPCEAMNVAVADFDGDGREDLVALGGHEIGFIFPDPREALCADYEDEHDDMYVLLNRYEQQGMQMPFEVVVAGTVPFPSASALAPGGPPTLHPGDFDGDSVTDLLVMQFSPGTASWFRGLGDGRFAEGKDIGLDATSRHAVGDFDGDGTLDLAAIGGQDEAGIWIWRGDLGLPDPDRLRPDGAVHASADMNRDGVSDLLVSEGGGYLLLLSNP